MEQQWEHKIKNTYQTQDANASFARKEELWLRIADGREKGVAAFWRIAAIFFAILLFGGVFASPGILNKHKLERQLLENKNRKLDLVVDSLLNVQPEKVTEIKLVETKKIVYKTVEVLKPSPDFNETKNDKLVLENKNLSSDILQLKKQLELKNDSLLIARNDSQTQKNETLEPPKPKDYSFKLKAEKVPDRLKSDLIKTNPELKLQLFNSQKNNIKFDTNSTLLRK